MLKMLTIASFALAVAIGPAHAQFAGGGGGWGCPTCDYQNGTQLRGYQLKAVGPNDLSLAIAGMQVQSLRLPNSDATKLRRGAEAVR